MATDNNGNVKPTLLHLGPLSLENVEKVRQINQAVLPLGYSQRFYQDLLDPQLAELCQVATTTHDGRDLVIGALCVDWDTKQQQKENTTPTDLWIMTLAVLAPFRDMGIGSRLLQSLLQGCRERGIVKVQLHVQTSNDDAIRFYTQRFGFIHNGKIENYYPRLDPPDCFVLLKVLDDGPRPTLIQTESTSLTTTPTGSNSRKRRKLSRETFLLPTSVL